MPLDDVAGDAIEAGMIDKRHSHTFAETLPPMSTPIDPVDSADLSPARWTSLYIALHWLVVVLVAMQFVDGEWMVAFFDGGIKGSALDGTTVVLGYLYLAPASRCSRPWWFASGIAGCTAVHRTMRVSRTGLPGSPP